MEANLGLKNLVAALKKYAPRQSQRVRVPAALLLLGEHDRACEFAENELREMAKATTAANDQYRRFVS
jgi:methylmalonyl-CoA mutase cobalamin-binding subunit